MEEKTTFIKLIPMKNSDSKIMMNKKVNPLQRIEIFENNLLEKISNFVHDSAFSQDDSSYQVSLFIKINDNFSKLPLSISIGELMIMTHQFDEPEIRYSFIKNEKLDDTNKENKNKTILFSKELDKINKQKVENERNQQKENENENQTVKINIPFQHNIMPSIPLNDHPNTNQNAQTPTYNQFPSLISVILPEQQSDLTFSSFGMNQPSFNDSVYHINDLTLQQQQPSIYEPNQISFSRFLDNRAGENSSNSHSPKNEQNNEENNTAPTLKSELEKMLHKT